MCSRSRRSFGLALGIALLGRSTLAAEESSCQVTPFTVPLRNCTFDTGVVSWGILIEAGTPGQRLCLAPSTVVNSTLVSQESLCAISDPGMNPLECESLRGGFFNENSSSTWTEASLQDFNSSRSDPTWAHFNPPGVTKVGYDAFYLPGGDGRTIHGYGLALNERGNNSNAGMLGLGIDSLFLDTAVKEKVIPSRSWSLYPGSQSQERPRNGEMVFGGYNQGKIDGSFRWKNVSDMSGDRPCPLRTTITDMYITLENGTQVPLQSSSEQVAACIEPYDNLFRFTPGMLLNWQRLTDYDPNLSTVYAVDNPQNLSFTELGLPYNASMLSKWSLTITVDNGYKTTLPHYELQAPLRGWSVLGERTEVPGVVNVAILDTPTGEGEIPTLGKIFLSQSYLAVDYEQNRFGLARSAMEPGPDKLVSLGCDADPPSKSEEETTEKKTPVGAIAGAAAGGAVALLLIGALIFWCWRRRRTARTAAGTGIATSGKAPPLERGVSYPASHATYPSMSEGWQSQGPGGFYAMPSPGSPTPPARETDSFFHASHHGSPPPFTEREIHEIGLTGSPPAFSSGGAAGAGGGFVVHEMDDPSGRAQANPAWPVDKSKHPT